VDCAYADEIAGEFDRLKFHEQAGFAKKHRLDLLGFKFKGEKFHKAAG
jgi:hypothetical protein